MNVSVPLVTAMVLSALLIGCAQQPTESEREQDSADRRAETSSEDADSAADADAKAAPPVPTRPFTSDTLYALLAAEIAGSRQQFDIALSNYLQQAHQTRDPQVAARATHIARFLSANNALLDAALLWVEVAPEDTEAQLNAGAGAERPATGGL